MSPVGHKVDMSIIVTVECDNGAVSVNPSTVAVLGIPGTRRTIVRAIAEHGHRDYLIARCLAQAVQEARRGASQPEAPEFRFAADVLGARREPA